MRFRAFASAVAITASLVSGQFVGGGAPAVAAESSPSFDQVVTLGDSFSAGVGARRSPNEYNEPCMRKSDENTGGRLAAMFAGGKQLNLACIGAQKGAGNGQPGADATIASLSLPNGGARTLINMSLFGNDVRSAGGFAWPDVVTKCLQDGVNSGLFEIYQFWSDGGSDNCQDNPALQPSAAEGARIYADALDTYRKLVAKAPNATIRIVGYPHLFEAQKQERWREPYNNTIFCWAGRSVLVPVDPNTNIFVVRDAIRLTGEEAMFLDAQVDSLNAVLRKATKAIAAETGADLKFVNVQSYYGNLAFCNGNSLLGTNINHINVKALLESKIIFLTSLHPTTTGYINAARAVADTLGTDVYDRKYVSFRSTCQRVSMLQSNSGRTTTEASEELDYAAYSKPLNYRERWLMRRVSAGQYTLMNQFDGTFMKPGDGVGAAVTQSGVPVPVAVTTLEDGTVEFHNATNPSLLVSLGGGTTYTPYTPTDMRAQDASCTRRFEPLFRDGLAEPAPYNQFDGKLVTLRSSCVGNGYYPGVIDVWGNSKQSGSAIDFWGYYGGDNQKWRFKAVGPSTYEINSASTGFSLAADWSSGAKVQQRAGDYKQKWFVQELGGAVGLFLYDSPGLAIDLPGASITYGSGLQMYPRNATCAQLWIPQIVNESSTPTTTTRFSNKIVKLKSSCSTAGTSSLLDVYGANKEDGGKVAAWTDYNGDNQKFLFTPVGGDEYLISPVHSKMYLSAQAWHAGNLVQSATPYRWKIEDNGATISLHPAWDPAWYIGFGYNSIANGNGATVGGSQYSSICSVKFEPIFQ